MAALTEDRITEYSLGDFLSIPVQADTRIFAGAIVCIDGLGCAVPAGTDSWEWTPAGIATTQADNRNGEAGERSVVVRRRGRYLLDLAESLPFQSLLGKGVYAVDDHTVAPASGPAHCRPIVGVIDKIDVEQNGVWVSIDSAVLVPRN